MAESNSDKTSAQSSTDTIAPENPEQIVNTVEDTNAETDETPEEPPTEETLLWRALMKETESDKDTVIYGNDRPDRFIRVGASRTEPVKVNAYAFSELGNYAATFYLTTGMGNIDIWDLRRPSKKKLRGKPQPMTLPFASHSFEVSEKVWDFSTYGEVSFRAGISSSGSQVAVCSDSDMGDGMILTMAVFKCDPAAPADHDVTKPWPLKRSTDIGQDLANKCGDITFRSTHPENCREQDDRFFKFDGNVLEIYSTYGKWNRIFVLSTKVDWMAKSMVATSIFDSVRGQLFVNTGIKGLASIWDYEAGKLISNISVPEDSKTVWASLSKEGSMVAIAVNGEIRVHDVATTIKVGVFKEGLHENNRFEMDFGQEYFMTNNYAASDSGLPEQPNARSIVRGAIVNIHEFGDVLSPVEDTECDTDCEIGNEITIHQVYDDMRLDLTSSEGVVFKARATDVYAPGSSYTALTITVEDDEGTVTQEGVICIGNARYYHFIFYVPESSQLFILTTSYLHVWDLSVTETSVCELAYVWNLQEYSAEHAEDVSYRTIQGVKSCSHGQRVNLTLSANSWLRGVVGLGGGDSDLPNDIITVPVSSAETIKLSEAERLVQGVPILATLYPGCDSNVRESITQYLSNHIRPSAYHPESSLLTLSRAWTSANRTSLEAIVSRLLPAKRITWIPDTNATKNTDPLAILLSTAETQPRVIGLVRVILNYCVSHASRTKNLAFMSPIFASMHELMEIFPEEAQECMSRISYIPAKQRSFIMDNHIIAHPPKVRMQFWNAEKKRLADSKNPILQLHESEAVPDPTNDKFTLPIFVAAFDALWNYKDNTKSKSKNDALAKTARPNGTTWWRTLYHMFLLKLKFRSHTYVECHNFSLEFFDNPAIAALVAYKWNTIGFMYWLIRFVFQCVFYFLVTIAALMQVYYKGPDQIHLVGVFVAIIVFGVVFLWLELLQATKNWARYASIYNILDMIAYTVPVAASIDQLVILYKGDATGNTRILSFSVLAVFIHALFELRINKSVCKYVTIIQETVIEIRVFFIIFAGGLFAFTVATLHLLRGCPVLGACEAPTTKLTPHFLGALSATYFFMGGRYDPVSDEFDSEDWGFHLMMVVYFFFTVIVMLNVLIALINVAFTKGDDSWRLVWIESRLRYIESAENMSYHIPGFRQSHNCFPKEIFYSATLQEVRAYREKYDSRASKNEDRDLLEYWERDDNDEEEDENRGAARTRKLGASQDKDNTSSASVNGDDQDEESNEEAQEDQGGDENEDANEEDGDGDDDEGADEEVVDVEGDEGDDEGQADDQKEVKDEDASVVKDLKVQVVKLQRQVSRQLKAQQEMHEQSQRQLQELRELLLAQNRA
ncbi:hypothetical protein BGZ72_000044 [Mortierella alpina]|nr:hypothetical protein BGZ72_000044 [Mortierella alpina]